MTRGESVLRENPGVKYYYSYDRLVTMLTLSDTGLAILASPELPCGSAATSMVAEGKV